MTSQTHATLNDNTAPHLDLYSSTTLFNHWYPYYYEVWQTNDNLSPVSLRFVYYTDSSNRPCINFSIGTSLNNSNFVNGNYAQFGTSPNSEIKLGGTGTARGAATFECDFSGSAGPSSTDTWFAMMLWRNATDAGAPLFIGFDRARNGTGTHADSYAFVHYANGGASPVASSQALFKPGAGVVGPKTGTNIPTWASVLPATDGSSRLYNGQTPASPVFPMLGYIGNPALTAVVFLAVDVTEGNQASVILYGVAHNYLISKQTTSFSGFWTTNVGGSAIGMRYE